MLLLESRCLTSACRPISKAWNKTLPGHCLDIGAVWYANSVLTIAADVAIIVLPMGQLWKLQLPRAQKLGLGVLFSLGALYVLLLPSNDMTTLLTRTVLLPARSYGW